MPRGARMSRGLGRRDMSGWLAPTKQDRGFEWLGVLVRLRAEIMLVVVVLAAFLWLDSLGHPRWVTATVLVGVACVVLVVPPLRRFVTARVWCVLDRHRIRTSLEKTKIRTMNRDGTLPYLLWARPTKTGERVWMWLPAGSAACDVEDALAYLAPACVARDARLHPVRKVTTLIAVDIIRRDPLTAKKPVNSPLSQFRSSRAHKDGFEPIRSERTPASMPTTEPQPAVEVAATQPSSGKEKKSTHAPPPDSVVVVNGEDLTDYVD